MPFPCGETWGAATYVDDPTYGDHGPDNGGPGGNYFPIDWNRANDVDDIVTASAAGTATVLSGGGYGTYIDIVHADAAWVSRYAHLNSTTLVDTDSGTPGIQVDQGDPIGTVGTTGGVAAHLHYEQRHNGVPVAVQIDGFTIPYTAPYFTYNGPTHTSNNCGGPSASGGASSSPTEASAGFTFIFGIGDNGHLYHRSRNDSGSPAWNGWSPNPGAPSGVDLQGTPAAVEADGNLFVSAVGDDGELHYRAWNATTKTWYANWTDLSAPGASDLQGSPELIAHDGHLFAVVVGENGDMFHRARPDGGSWGGWSPNPGGPSGVALRGSPSLAATDGYLFNSAMGENGEIYYRARRESDGVWLANWSNLGAPGASDLQGSPELLAHDGHLFAFGIGENGAMFHRARPDGSGFGGWSPNPGSPSGVDLQGTPSAAASDGNLFVAALGTDGSMYYRARNDTNNTWYANWTDLGEPAGVNLLGSPSLVHSDGFLFAVAIGSDGNVHYRARPEGSSWLGWTNRGAPAGIDLDAWLEPDRDGDGVPDASDNCSAVSNADQSDLDLDGIGDVCDPVDDRPMLIPGFYGSAEGDTGSQVFDIPITLSKSWPEVVTVDVLPQAWADTGFATEGVDFDAPTPTTLTFLPGETVKTVPVTVFGDTIAEPPLYLGEWLVIRFLNPSANAVLDMSLLGLGVGIIGDDD